jgi:large subunit ribosomal protein L4
MDLSPHLQVETEQVTLPQYGASQKKTRFLKTGICVAALTFFVVAFSGKGLTSSVGSGASAGMPSQHHHHASFSPSMPSLRSASMRTPRAGLSPAMRAVPTVNFEGTEIGETDMDLKVAKAGAYVIHRKVVAEQANMRLGTAQSKTRAEVRGGGRKPYQQKGTGRARRGSSRSPLLTGGGVIFGPSNDRNYHKDMNKKEKQVAISTALMSVSPRTKIVENFDSKFTSPKTSEMKNYLDRLGVDTKNAESTLILTTGSRNTQLNTYLSARNIFYLNLLPMDNLNVRDLLKAKKIFITNSAFDIIKERYGVPNSLQPA